MSWENLTEEFVKKPKKEASTQVGNPFQPFQKMSLKRGIKMGIYGLPSTGKTHFALAAEGPVYIIDTELGSTPLKAKFKDKEVHIVEIFEPNEENLERDDVKCFLKIREGIDWVYKNADSGTIVIDSVTDLWKLCQSYCKVVIFKLKPEERLKYRWDWGVMNNLYQQLILKLLNMPLNVILVARSTEVYNEKGEGTGRFEASWMKQTPYLIDVVVHIHKRFDKKDGVYFESEVVKSRFGRELIGKTFKNFTFKQLKEEIENESISKIKR